LAFEPESRKSGGVAEKRKLPVLQSTPTGGGSGGGSRGGGSSSEDEGEGEERPPWHWVGFGTVGIFGAWLPAMWLAQKVSDRLVARVVGNVPDAEGAARSLANASAQERFRVGLMLAIPHGIALALAAVAGGYLVGRYGKLGPREAAISGVALGIVVGGLTFGVVGPSGFVAPLALAVPFAALGGHIGKKRAATAKD
jgi:tRNA-(ms[2]io[6]A)-hydroxylase